VALSPVGAAVVEAGSRFSAIGILTEGEASVVRRGEHRRVVHRTLRAGDVFGVSSLFGQEDGFPTDVVTTAPSRILFLDEEDVRAMVTAVPRIAFNYIALLSDKIRFLNRRLDTLAGRSAEERVAEHLLSGIGADGILGTTKSALASLLGLGRASLYRILDLFEKKGWILTHRDRIEILDAVAIKSFITDRKETKK
jgi:CRP-like cAMP-binding protein